MIDKFKNKNTNKKSALNLAQIIWCGGRWCRTTSRFNGTIRLSIEDQIRLVSTSRDSTILLYHKIKKNTFISEDVIFGPII